MVRLWWLWWPQPARPPPQRWRQAAEHREAPRGVTPPQPDTTWQDPEVLRGFRGASPAVVVDPPPMAAPRQRQRLAAAEDGGEDGVKILAGKCSPEKMEARRKNPPEKF
ncbi:hypothetical protein Tco_0499909 [Tanacetum coccineum]